MTLVCQAAEIYLASFSKVANWGQRFMPKNNIIVLVRSNWHVDISECMEGLPYWCHMAGSADGQQGSNEYRRRVPGDSFRPQLLQNHIKMEGLLTCCSVIYIRFLCVQFSGAKRPLTYFVLKYMTNFNPGHINTDDSFLLQRPQKWVVNTQICTSLFHSPWTSRDIWWFCGSWNDHGCSWTHYCQVKLSWH